MSSEWLQTKTLSVTEVNQLKWQLFPVWCFFTWTQTRSLFRWNLKSFYLKLFFFLLFSEILSEKKVRAEQDQPFGDIKILPATWWWRAGSAAARWPVLVFFYCFQNNKCFLKVFKKSFYNVCNVFLWDPKHELASDFSLIMQLFSLLLLHDFSRGMFLLLSMFFKIVIEISSCYVGKKTQCLWVPLTMNFNIKKFIRVISVEESLFKNGIRGVRGRAGAVKHVAGVKEVQEGEQVSRVKLDPPSLPPRSAVAPTDHILILLERRSRGTATNIYS